MSLTISQHLLKLTSIESMMPSNHLILCHPLLLVSSVFHSISLSQWVSSLDQVALVLELQHQFFRWIFRVGFDWVIYDHAQFTIEWFDHHAVQGTLKSLPQHNSLKASALWFNLLYGPNLTSIPGYWKNLKFDYMDLCWQSDVSKLFNALSRFVIAFLPRGKRLLILWLQSLSTLVLKLKRIKSVTISTFYPSVCHEVKGLDSMILVFWMLSFKPAFSLSSFTLIKRLFSSSSLYAIRVISSAYLRLLIYLPVILIPASDSSNLEFHKRMYSA